MIFSNDFFLRISISLILIVINSTLIHYIANKLNIYDNSFHKPTVIAIIISKLFLITSYLNYKIILFLITLIIITLITQKIYQIDLKKATTLILIWLISLILLSLLIVFLFYIF